MNRNRKIIIGLVSLIGVLAYNWTHTGGLLASYVRPAFVGYIAATGIELAVVGLSLRIADLRRNASGARFQVATLAAVVVVSALANIAEGYAVKFGESLTSDNIGRLDIVQAIVSLSATGLLSLVTFAIAEIVGGDIEQQPAQPIATDLQPSGDDCHCPTCNSIIGLPVWLLEQHGDRYIAYCDKCERAYTESEVAWLPSANQVGASMTQPAQPTETDAASTPLVADVVYSTQQSHQNGPQSAAVAENELWHVGSISETESAVFELDTIEARLAQVSLTGKYTVDMANCLLAVPEAKAPQLAKYIGCSRQHVDNTIKRWEQDKKISKNGSVTFLDSVK